jgi:CubicO group peptidase (beta-lactamase class C family)
MLSLSKHEDVGSPSLDRPMTDTDIRGLCPDRFAAVRAAFQANFDEGTEQGARFALAIEGEIVIDLIGGTRDRAREQPFDEDTLTPVFSTTKAMASLMIARLVDQERLWWDQPVADV